MPAANITSTTALVVCGGLGSRLRPVVGDRPAILAPVAGRPFAHHLIEALRDEGLVDIVLCTGYGADQVIASCGDGSEWGVRIRHSREPRPLGTGGAVRHSERLVDSDPFLVVNGDSYVDADLPHLLEFHRRVGARLTLVLASVPDRSRYDSVETDPQGAVTAFAGKGARGPGLVSAGVYLLDRGVIESIPRGQVVSLERDVIPRFVGSGLYGLAMEGAFLDIGTPESFAQAEALFSRPHDGGARS
jgi:D-glycero-alpha-D-manno-heptose 1-phosphate guanylyltransferase